MAKIKDCEVISIELFASYNIQAARIGLATWRIVIGFKIWMKPIFI